MVRALSARSCLNRLPSMLQVAGHLFEGKVFAETAVQAPQPAL